MMFPKRLTKRERLAAIMAEIDTSQIRELPEEAEASTTSEIGVAKSISITEDGRHWQDAAQRVTAQDVHVLVGGAAGVDVQKGIVQIGTT